MKNGQETQQAALSDAYDSVVATLDDSPITSSEETRRGGVAAQAVVGNMRVSTYVPKGEKTPELVDVVERDGRVEPIKIPADKVGVIRRALGFVGVTYSLISLRAERDAGGETKVTGLNIDWKWLWLSNGSRAELAGKRWAKSAAASVLSLAANAVSTSGAKVALRS